jgi:hypothetical protein
MARIGNKVYPMLSFRTTTVFKQAWACHLLKLSMGESAEPPDVVRSWRACPSWTRTHKGSEERVADIHPVFHVSQLRRCLRVSKKERVPEEEIDLQTDLRYQEVPVMILDTVTKRTRNSEVRICRVQWSRHEVEEATWEREDALKKGFPIYLGASRISRMRFILSGVGL